MQHAVVAEALPLNLLRVIVTKFCHIPWLETGASPLSFSFLAHDSIQHICIVRYMLSPVLGKITCKVILNQNHNEKVI